MQIEKNKLRAFAKDFRKSLSADEKARKDKIIFEKVVQLDAYKSAKRVLLYFPKAIEVDTKAIIQYAFENNKQVFLPKCVGEHLQFYQVDSYEQLQEGHFGLLEPKETCKPYENSQEQDLCIIPALMADSLGFRLGYGKGFYDRFLKDFNGCKCIVCYFENLVKNLPIYPTDIKADIVVVD